MTNENISALDNFLKKEVIPPVKDKPLTFLGITKQPHFETVWSNIYAFFFRTDAEHNLKDLFIYSLLSLINNDQPRFKFELPFCVETEWVTDKNGRIDILLANDKEAIIIENKVFHHLANDLDDYWNSVNIKNKIGILLVLHNSSVRKSGNFLYITHLELLETVIANLPKYFAQGSDKYILFLKDFYQNIINTTNLMDKCIIDFYRKHIDQICKIEAVKKNFVQYVISQVEQVPEYLDDKFELSKSRNDRFRQYLCPIDPNLMITVVFEDMFRPDQYIKLIVELQNELLKKKDKIRTIEFNPAEVSLIRNDFYNSGITPTWQHFALQILKPSDSDMESLHDYIATELNKSPIIDIYKKIKIALVDSTTLD